MNLLKLIKEREKDFEEFFPELLTEAGEVSRDINAFNRQTSVRLIEGIIEIVDKVASVNDSNGRFNACEAIKQELQKTLKVLKHNGNLTHKS